MELIPLILDEWFWDALPQTLEFIALIFRKEEATFSAVEKSNAAGAAPSAKTRSPIFRGAYLVWGQKRLVRIMRLFCCQCPICATRVSNLRGSGCLAAATYSGRETQLVMEVGIPDINRLFIGFVSDISECLSHSAKIKGLRAIS